MARRPNAISFSGRRARRRASSSARHKQGAPPQRRDSRMGGAQRPRHVVRRTQRDSDQRRRRPHQPQKLERPAGREPAGQKQSLSSIFSPRMSSRAWPEGAPPACQAKRARGFAQQGGSPLFSAGLGLGHRLLAAIAEVRRMRLQALRPLAGLGVGAELLGVSLAGLPSRRRADGARRSSGDS